MRSLDDGAERGGVVRFQLLGPLTVEGATGVIELPSYKQRSLLALLLIHADQIVSTDRIIDALWGPAGPADPRNVLWVHVSNLRKALDSAAPGGGELLVTRQPGYILRPGPHATDTARFEALAAEGRALLLADPAAASIVLAEALALWNGLPLEDFAYEEWAQPEIARLSALRLAVVEARIDADLARGLSSELVGELEALVVEHPLKEHFTAQLMAALWGSGRHAEALRAMQRLRLVLGEELGLEPSDEVQQLEDRMLRNDPTLVPTASRTGGSPAAGLAVRGYELRERIRESDRSALFRAFQPSVGREVAIEIVASEVADDPGFIRSFESRARAAAGVGHPNLLPLYDFWREPGGAYVVSPLLTGGTLADVLDEEDVGRAVTIVQSAASALAVSHTHGLVHGSIHPGEIHLDEDGEAFLRWHGLTGWEDGASGYVAPEVRDGGCPTPSSDVFSLGAMLAELDLPAAFDDAITQATDPDPGRRFSDAGELVAALGEVEPEPPAPDAPPNPYKGLHAFQRSDSAHFHGRERLVERLVARLGSSGARGRFTAVVGPSGSGKSSVVKAGLLPALNAGALPGSERWFTVEMTPAPRPFDALAGALAAVAPAGAVPILDGVAAGTVSLARGAAELLADGGSRLVLVVDQFEELFTQVSADVAERFVAGLLDAIEDPACPIKVVITVRSDHVDGPLLHRRLSEPFRRATELIGPMTPEEMERAIVRPLGGSGVEFEPGLVARIISDVVDQPGALPLLQYTLTQLFDQREGPILRSRDYAVLGAVSGALANRADGVVARLDERLDDVARRLLLRLVTLGEGAGDTRRRVPVSELWDVAPRPAVDAVLDAFGAQRMLTFDRDPVTRRPTAEIAHESLLRDWPALRRWIDESRDDLRLGHTLERQATEWLDAGRPDDLLLTGRRLDQAMEFVGTTDLALRPSVEGYVSAADAAALAAAAKRRRGRRRVLTSLTAAAAVSLVLALVAVVGQRRAEENAAIARAGEWALAAISDEVLTNDPELSLLLALQSAAETEPSVETLTALHQAIANHRTLFYYEWPAGQEFLELGGDLSPDGRLLLAHTIRGGDYLEVVDLETSKVLWSIEEPGNRVMGYFVAGGEEVVVNIPVGGTRPAGLYVVEARTGVEKSFVPGGPCGYDLPIAPAARSATALIVLEPVGADCGMPLEVQVFDVESRQTTVLGQIAIQGLQRRDTKFIHPAISSDGNVVAFPTQRPPGGLIDVEVHDLRTGDMHGLRLTNVVLALNHDGTSLLVNSGRNGVVVDVASGEVTMQYRELSGSMTSVGFDPNSRRAHTGSEFGSMHVWDTWNGRTLDVIAGAVPSVGAMSGDGARMVFFATTRVARVVDTSAEAGAELARPEIGFVDSRSTEGALVRAVSDGGAVSAIGDTGLDVRVSNSDIGREVVVEARREGVGRVDATFLAGSDHLVLSFLDRLVVIDGATLETLAVRDWVEGAAPAANLTAAPDGSFVAATSDFEPFIELLDPTDLTTLWRVDVAHQGIIMALTTNADGSLVASGGRDGWVRVWSTDDGTLIHAIQAPRDVRGVEFTEDDRHIIVTLDTTDRYEYTLDPDELLDIARSKLTRGFTEQECARFDIDPCPTLEEMRAG